ncbi:MAG: BACON domain-containing protein [Fimbriimonadaceae bacterium]|nr:BACON domain-containing protein [Fimbriimonadaceae bacterium]
MRRCVGLGAIGLLASLLGCSSDDGTDQSILPTITLAPGSLHFTAGVTALTVVVNPSSSDVAWTLLPTETWLGATPNAGVGRQTVTVTVSRDGLAPGSYTAGVRATSSVGSPLLPVTVDVPGGSNPALSVSSTSLDFGAALNSLPVTLRNGGGGTLSWSAAELVTWANVSPRSGTGEGTLTVSLNRALLPVGTHRGWVRVTSNGGTASLALTVLVTSSAVVAPVGQLTADPAALVYATGESSRQVALSSSEAGVTWSVSSSATWLTATPGSGSGSGTLTANIDRSQLDLGLNAATVTLQLGGTGSGVLAIPVSVVITGGSPLPQIAVSPALLVFAPNASSKTVDVSNLGAAGLTWTAAANVDWITITPDRGADTATVTIDVDRSNPASASGRGTITWSSNGGTVGLEVLLAR